LGNVKQKNYNNDNNINNNKLYLYSVMKSENATGFQAYTVGGATIHFEKAVKASD